MKFVNNVPGDNSDEEEFEEDQLRNVQETVMEKEEENEGNNDEDSIHEKENIPLSSKDTSQRKSLGGGNKKIFLEKSTTKKPSTQKMVDKAIQELNEKGGSSTEAIKKFIMSKDPSLVERRLKLQIKRYIKNCLTDGTMVQIKRSFKFSNKHEIKKKEKLANKKIKQKEKDKLTKEENVQNNGIEAAEKKFIKKKKKPSEKAKDKINTAKKSNKENREVQLVKKTKFDKDAKNSETIESKKIENKKLKNKLPRKSINLVIKPLAPHQKIIKSKKSMSKETKMKVDLQKSKNASVPSTSAAVKASARGKKK